MSTIVMRPGNTVWPSKTFEIISARKINMGFLSLFGGRNNARNKNIVNQTKTLVNGIVAKSKNNKRPLTKQNVENAVRSAPNFNKAIHDLLIREVLAKLKIRNSRPAFIGAAGKANVETYRAVLNAMNNANAKSKLNQNRNASKNNASARAFWRLFNSTGATRGSFRNAKGNTRLFYMSPNGKVKYLQVGPGSTNFVVGKSMANINKAMASQNTILYTFKPSGKMVPKPMPINNR